MLLAEIAAVAAARSHLPHHYGPDDAGDFPAEPPSAPSYTAIVTVVGGAAAVGRDSKVHRYSK
jgi:hypothetical protein